MTERRRTPPRPYAKQRTYPSVTTVIGVMDKGGLAWGAAKETALFAVHHRDKWQNLDTDDAVERLRKHHRVMWDARAGVGTLVHSVNEAWSWDEEADLVAIIEKMERRPTLWDGAIGLAGAIAEVQPFVDGLERFWNDFQPDTVATEQVVRLPDKRVGYIGQTDWLAVLGSDLWRLDIKSTARLDDQPWTDSWRPQLAAYDRAPEVVFYTPEGVEDGTEPNLHAERFGVVHLLPDGSYHLIELDAGDEPYNAFRAMRLVYDWLQLHKRPAPRLVPAPDRQGALV